MANPPLGWIRPQDRTQAQNDAHRAAVAKHVMFGLPFTVPPKGTKIILTDLWSDPDCVADMGQVFTGFHQLTGSCVGASDGNAVVTTSCVQRKFATNPTKAFIHWWPFTYGRTRYNEGDRGQGEGAVDSVMGQTLGTEGCFSITEAKGLPTFDTSDGFTLTSQIEMKYSDGAASVNTQYMSLAATHLMGSRATLSTSDDIAAAITNGYAVLDGCDNYVGNGTIKGNGADAYVVGHYDGRGGHSTCILGYWNHPNDGELFLYSNQWAGNTYPKDPAGGGRCCVWIPRSEMDKLFHTGGSGGETMALSALGYFPAVPAILSWYA